jgi:cobaltochelatase CobT
MNRAVERQRSAAVRAVGRDPKAEFRGGRLTSGNKVVDIASPFLTLAANESPVIMRGLGDALALILRHTDRELHQSLVPVDTLQRVIFDMLEQLRCQALAPDLRGIQQNLAAASDAWCQNARANGVAESGVGLLVYSLMHMARARLRLGMTDEEVDNIIEMPRVRLGRLIGHALQQLPGHMQDQAAFAADAREIARLVAELAEASEFADGTAGSARYQMLVPPEWLDLDTGQDDGMSGIAVSAVPANERDQTLNELGDYRAFSTEYDVVLQGNELYPLAQRRRARTELDQLIQAQAVSAHRIALRLRQLFGTFEPDEWRFGVEEGIVDGRRLPQLVANPMAREVFQRPRHVLRTDAVVSLLMDNSGSMKAQRYETLAVLADTLSRALDLANVPHEILGHTTAAWTGGRALEDWRAAGKPEDPGRLAEISGIIYKDADTTWKRARHSLASMQLTHHFRESIDGEAIIWAHGRLMQRPERRKMLVVVSDGAPAEAATNKANRKGYLSDHLVNVVDFIERRTPVEIGALTVDNDVSSVFRRSLPIDLDATLTVGAYGVFEELFR